MVEHETMKKILVLTLTLIIITLSLSACGSGRRVATSSWAELTTDQDTAYLAAGPQVYAVNLNNGSLKWQYPPEIDPKISFYAAPVLTDDGQLIVGGYDNVLYSLDPANGNLNWTYEEAQGRYIGRPLVTPEGIFAPSADGNLYAINFQGQELWEPFPTEEPIWAEPISAEDCECIYVASMDHRIYAIDPQKGTLLWKTEGLGGSIVSAPSVSDSALYASTFDQEIIAIDTDTQSITWRFETKDWAWASPVLDGDQLYVSDIAGNFYALDATNGEQLWQIQPGGEIVSPPLVLDEKIYFGTSDGAFIIAGRDGTIQQNNTLEGKLYSSPVATGDLVLVAPTEQENLLLGYDPSGVQKWSFTLSEE
ncbi:MAG: Desiccation/radiation resistance protein [Chloroflexi bacterium]|nr:Desiccation/radiation resistance protein [Chloroflexota bacterium]